MADLLGIGTSGLLAYQNALNTTSHNISNVNTEGYSRQRVELDTRIPQASGAGFFGQGVYASNVERVYDEFLVKQLRTYTSSSNRAEVYHDLSSQIDNLLADPQVGLAPSLDEFFSSLQSVADSPSSIPARQAMLSTAESLVDRFHYIDQRLRDLKTRANNQLEFTVGEVNKLAESLATINQEISVQMAAAGGKPPNDLLDQRDTLIKQLSEHVNVSTVNQDNGMVNIFIGSGQGLVVGSNATQLSIRSDEFFPDRNAVVLGNPATGPDISGLLGDGSVGGVLDFMDNVLTPTQISFGRLAMGMADAFNEQHALGLDLKDNAGTDFFRAPAPTAFGSFNNTTNALPTLTLVDVAALGTDEYLIEFDGVATWSALNMRTNAVTTPLGVTTIDGVQVDVTTIGAVAGDTYRFVLSPSAQAARDIGLVIDDPSKIAAAGLLRGGEAVDANGQPLVPNAGTGSIDEIVVSDNALYPLAADITMTYDDVNNWFVLGGAAAGTLAYDPATDNGQLSAPFVVGGTSIQLRLSGNPQTGDQFTVGNNSGAVADNRNALALGALGSADILIGGTSSLQGAYGQMIADVGAKTHQAEVTLGAQTTLLNQAAASVSAVSGVNLDEEAANLLRFQQAYQANAQMISAADNLFQTLLDAVRR